MVKDRRKPHHRPQRWTLLHKLGAAAVLAGGIVAASLYRSPKETVPDPQAQARLEQLHDAHVEKVTRKVRKAATSHYNEIASLSDLVQNSNVYELENITENAEQGTQLRYDFEKLADKKIANSTTLLRHSSVVIASPLPASAEFQRLEKELNDELKRFAEYIDPLSRGNFPHEVVALTSSADIRHPRITKGRVPIFFVNSGISYSIFTGLHGKDHQVRLSERHPDSRGGISHFFSGARVVQSRIYISPEFQKRGNLRYSALVNTTIAEYLHSLFFGEKLQKITGTIAKWDQYKPEKLKSFIGAYLQGEESILHAASLRYLMEFPQHRDFCHPLPEEYKRDPYTHVEAYLASVQQFRFNGKRIHSKTQVYTLLELFQHQRLDYLLDKDGARADAVTRYLTDVVPARIKKK
ncbi:MAG TPA: hypothetical protein VJK72_05410 [Candidatus Nanoarchaeia archaeon]|nr:hypothetical protein [Candidatus Nanoarchaeia archaeon]